MGMQVLSGQLGRPGRPTMTFRLKLAAMIAVAGIAWSSASANAWHAAGHMMVAAVAWDQMTPTARARAIELLKLNPDYNSWIAGVADAEKDKTAFVRAATWLDDIKCSPGCGDNLPWFWDGLMDANKTPAAMIAAAAALPKAPASGAAQADP